MEFHRVVVFLCISREFQGLFLENMGDRIRIRFVSSHLVEIRTSFFFSCVSDRYSFRIFWLNIHCSFQIDMRHWKEDLSYTMHEYFLSSSHSDVSISLHPVEMDSQNRMRRPRAYFSHSFRDQYIGFETFFLYTLWSEKKHHRNQIFQLSFSFQVSPCIFQSILWERLIYFQKLLSLDTLYPSDFVFSRLVLIDHRKRLHCSRLPLRSTMEDIFRYIPWIASDSRRWIFYNRYWSP